MSGKREVLVPCNRAGTCSYLVVERWDDDDEFYADIYVRPATWTFRARLQAAKRALFGQALPHDMTISAEEARLLRDWLVYELRVRDDASNKECS